MSEKHRQNASSIELRYPTCGLYSLTNNVLVNRPSDVAGCTRRKRRRESGTRLGLSLTKNLAELHGGKTWVESEGNGKGCTFCFTMPIYVSNWNSRQL
ncbi:MAG: hypothetical protein KKB35_06285 [Proteobacteria bacterium]|nr:hypothetical protein [Pseudomonadota bacterium]